MPVQQSDSDIVITAGTSQAKIALHGAHVYSWTVEGEEQLFLSSETSINGPAAIRGGIPICFPVFGPPPKYEPFSHLKQHGFARTCRWKFDGTEEQDANSIQAKFSLDNTPEIRKIFPVDFQCYYKVKIYEKTLHTTLEINNPSTNNDFNFQALLHTYLRLPSGVLPNHVLVGPLKDLSFTDKVQGGKVGTENRIRLDFKEGEVDRVYDGVSDTIEVRMGDQKVMAIKTVSLPNLTVWNPHQVKSDAMVDMEKDGWKRFVCVEPGQTSFVKLAPKSSWIGEQVLSIQKI